MDRRDFSKYGLAAGAGLLAGCNGTAQAASNDGQPGRSSYREPARDLPAREFDVVVAGAGTAGVMAALASARQRARTLLIERKGYPGGTVTEGGTALHSFYNLWKAFDGAEKRQVVRGLPQEIVDRLMAIGGCSGHAEMSRGYNYDSVCTAIDTELYKLVAFEMLDEAGVVVAVHTLLAGAIRGGSRLRGVITESRDGREAILADAFVDCTAYGDLSAYAGARYTEPNDYDVCNSIALANVDVDRLGVWLEEHNAVTQRAEGLRSGREGQIVRLQGNPARLPGPFAEEANRIGMSMVTTTVHDNYFMFIKVNMRLPVSPTSRDAVSRAELELRKRHLRAVELFRRFVPGCEKAFIARTSPGLNIRRGRLISCDYDITHEDVIEGRHFDDEIMVYGFHDMAPHFQIKDGGTYGIPYRALCVQGLDNLYACGMMITSDRRAHMSTRNTVCSMGQGQDAGTAAALCALRGCTARQLPYPALRERLEKDGVTFES